MLGTLMPGAAGRIGTDMASAFHVDALAGRRRLRFRVDGAVDTDELSSLAAVLSVQATDGELRLELREEAELGELLVAVGRRARVLEVESERVSLHQVYVERLGRPVDGASP